MAAASYTTDLTDIDTADTNTTYTNIGTGADAQETDYFIQGTACVSKPFNITAGGIYHNEGAGVTFNTGEVFWIWTYFAAPNALLSETSGGMRALVGSSGTAYNMWNLYGSDNYTYGGWRCYPVDVVNVSADATTGSPGATRQYFGVYCNTSVGISKGNPLGLDCMRKGRGEMRINGGDLANGYATFSGYATQNDKNTTGSYNRWGLFQYEDGAYRWQGLMVLGYTSAVDFRDSNKSVVVNNTKKVQSTFNRIEVRQASSRVDWTNINITALGTTSRGDFECIDNADVNFETCVFTDMGTWIFQSGSTILNSTFRRTGLITQGGAVFDGCVIDSNRDATKAMLVSNLDNIDNCTFISDGTGHAIELTSAHAGGSYTLAGTIFTGYGGTPGSNGTASSGSTDAAIYNNSGGSVTINITNGGTTPAVRNGAGATTTIVSGTVPVTVTAVTAEGTPVQDVRVLVTAATGGPMPFDVTVTIANSSTTATVTHSAHGLSTNDKIQIKGASHYQNNGVFSVTVSDANTYTYTMPSAPGSNPTGTIKATFVPLYGMTDSSGVVSQSRTYASDQPITGKGRKSSSAPYYKTAPISGTIDSADGFSTSLVMILDS
jgi:hypothetical protein